LILLKKLDIIPLSGHSLRYMQLNHNKNKNHLFYRRNGIINDIDMQLDRAIIGRNSYICYYWFAYLECNLPFLISHNY